MRGFAEASGAIAVLAEAAGELVGFCVVQMEQTVGYVVTLDVAAAWRRRGLARRLIAEVATRVRAAGGSGMALHVFNGNTAAVQFYEAIGWATGWGWWSASTGAEWMRWCIASAGRKWL